MKFMIIQYKKKKKKTIMSMTVTIFTFNLITLFYKTIVKYFSIMYKQINNDKFF